MRAEIVLDGGAYASSTPAVVANAATLGAGPYVVPNVSIDCYGAYTNNPPCGAMRGFGAVQAAFGYESQMDRLAEAVGLDPAEIRMRNGLAEGDQVATGQVLDSAAPVAELVRRVRDMPLPAPATSDLRSLPGGVANTTHGEGVRRGVGYGVGIKNICFSEGFDDYSTARVTVQVVGGRAARHRAHRRGRGRAGTRDRCRSRSPAPSSASRRCTSRPQTPGWARRGRPRRPGRATSPAARCRRRAARWPPSCWPGASVAAGVAPGSLSLEDGYVVGPAGERVAAVIDLVGEDAVERTVEWRHRPTTTLDPETGQGSAHVQFAFAAHRAVVDVDVELGLVKVVALDCAQDVGRALNPGAVLGQIHGGSAQGLGLAVMEEIQVVDGLVRNPSFTDYLIPTVLDMPPMRVDVLELADPHAPYGLRGVGEPPTISSTPAVVAAIRAATGLALTRVPVRPEHLTGT